MIKKEWREVGYQSLYFVLAVSGMVLLVGLVGMLEGKPFEGEKAIIMLGLWLLMFSMFIGLSPFAMDSKQKGMEYLLSLPYSRRRLLWIKLMPRLGGVVLFYGVFFLLYHSMGHDAFGGGFAFFSLAYFALFLISFSLSLVHENFIVQSIWAGIAWCAYLASSLSIVMLGFSWKFGLPVAWDGMRLWHELSYDVPTLLSASAVFMLLALPFILSIFLAIQRFDLKPARVFNRRQLFFFMPLLLLAFAASLGLTFAVQRNSNSMETGYFLLGNGRLLKTDFPGRLSLYDEQGRRLVKTGKKLFWEWVHFEAPEKVFLVGYDMDDSSTLVIRLGLKDLAWKAVYSIPDGFEATPGGLFKQSGPNLVFLKHGQGNGPRAARAAGSDRIDLVQLDMDEERARTVSFRSPLFSGCTNLNVFASDEASGRSFWLACGKDGREKRIFRLWADGAIDNLGVSTKLPAYFGRLLFTHSANSLIVRRLTSGADETIGEMRGAFQIANDYFSDSLDTAAAREIFGTRNQRLVRIDLETLAVDDLGPERGRILRAGTADFYYIEHAAWVNGQKGPDAWRRVFRLQGKDRAMLKQFDFNGRWPGDIGLQRHGIVLRDSENRKCRFFAFPGLRELEFKGMK